MQGKCEADQLRFQRQTRAIGTRGCSSGEDSPNYSIQNSIPETTHVLLPFELETVNAAAKAGRGYLFPTFSRMVSRMTIAKHRAQAIL